MATINDDFENLEKITATNFKSGIEKTKSQTSHLPEWHC